MATDYTTHYRIYAPNAVPLTNWQPDVTSWQTRYPVQLAAYGAAIYALITGLDGLVWYKQAYYNS